MTTKKTAKKQTYTLVVDDQLDHIFNYLMQLAVESDKFHHSVIKNGLEKRWLDFLEESAAKNHDLGWCRDPNCKDNR